MMQNNQFFNNTQAIIATDRCILSAPSNEPYSLRWKGKYLIVRAMAAASSEVWPQDFDPDWLAACLIRSPVQVIRLDLRLSAAVLELWANAADKAGKQVYVSLPIVANLPQKNQPWGWWLKRVIDYVITIMLLTILIPIGIGLIGILRPKSWQQTFVWDWHVGERGKLFPMFRLRTVDDQGRWLRGGRMIRRFRLDRLPKFFNVLRGELSLVGSCPWLVADAAQSEMGLRYRLNGLPGVTGLWHWQSRLALLDGYFLSEIDLDYLWHWSLGADLRFLVLSIPRAMMLM
jgi:lipopolysaccharide/colanic/teichoic acid biosynthesis glycosyltransferase